MKVLIALSLGEGEQACTLTVVDSKGGEKQLTATAGQCHIEVADGDTITLGPKPAPQAAA